MEKVQRKFIIGDEWFYFKLYTGAKTADVILIEAIQPLVKELFEKGLIDKWFFIRYADPELHLRIRFKLTDVANLGKVIELLNAHIKYYIDSGLIFSMQVDTYSRELERYGHSTVENAESLFFYDSMMTIEMLNIIEGDGGEIYRWHFALLAIDALLSDFSLTETKKFELLNSLQYGFGQEFGMDNSLKVQLDKKFRDERKTIAGILSGENDFYRSFYRILEEKSEATKEIVTKIKRLNSKNELELELYNLLGSYIHMLLNRIFKSKQRLNEMVVYSLLYRYYKSEVARKKKNAKVLSPT